MLCWSRQLYAMASIVEEQYLVMRHFFHSTLRCLNPGGKKINNLIYNTFKSNLGPGAVKTGLVTKASNCRAVKHLPASLWAEKPSPGWGSQNGNAVSHSNNVTSLWPHSQSQSRGMSGGASQSRDRQEFRHSSHRLLCVSQSAICDWALPAAPANPGEEHQRCLWFQKSSWFKDVD